MVANDSYSDFLFTSVADRLKLFVVKVAGKQFHSKLAAIYKLSHLTSCAITYSQTWYSSTVWQVLSV